MQVLSILTMERPVSFEAEDIRDEKASSLRVPFLLHIIHSSIISIFPYPDPIRYFEISVFTFTNQYMLTKDICDRSRFSVQFLQLSVVTHCLVSMSRPTVNRAILMTRRSHPTRTVPRMPPLHCGFTTHDGRVFLSFSRLGRVSIFIFPCP